MKIITRIALFAMILTSMSLFAQGHNPEKMIETLKAELELSEEQATQIQAIMEANKPDFAKKCDKEGKDCDKSAKECCKKDGKECDKKDAENCSKKQKGCKKGKGMKHGMRGHGGGKMEGMKAHREKVHTEIEAILTPEQVATFREFTEAKQAEMVAQHGERGNCKKIKKHHRPMHPPKHARILHAVVLMTVGAGLFYLGTTL